MISLLIGAHVSFCFQLNDTQETEGSMEFETNTQYFLRNVMSRLNQPIVAINQIKVWDRACQDLLRLAQIDNGLAPGVELLATQLQCHLLIAKVMQNSTWLDSSSLNTQEGDVVKNWIEELQKRSLRCNRIFVSMVFRCIMLIFFFYSLQYLFCNLSSDEELLIQSTRLQAMAVQLVYIVRASNTSALALSDHFVSRVETLAK